MSPFSKALIVTIGDRTDGKQTLPCFFPDQLPLPVEPEPRMSDLLSRAEAEPFSLLMNEPHKDNIVRQCGEKLYEDLVQNDQIKESLRKISDAPDTPIYLRLRDFRAGNLPWEALFLNQYFLALNTEGHIARLGKRVADPAVDTRRWIEPALRVLVILAAAPNVGREERVDATGEWQRIWQALDPLGAKVRVFALVCQQPLADQIQSGQDPRIQCEVLTANNATAIRAIVSQFAPNIVHFFCHGAKTGQARLEIANLRDYERDVAEGSIRLSSADLAAIGQHDSVWLLTLNCCKGAHAPGMGSKSIAGYVADQGVPAVVAMRDDVNYNDAHIFAGAFYRGLVDSLSGFIPTDTEANEGKEIEIPENIWVKALYPSRAELSTGKRVPETWPEWTLPVVYVQEGPMFLKARQRTGEARVAAQALSIASDSAAVAPAQNGEPVSKEQPTETAIARLRLRLEKLANLQADIRAMNGPAELIKAFDAEIAKTTRECIATERDTLVQTLDALKGANNVSADMFEAFYSALDALNDKLALA